MKKSISNRALMLTVLAICSQPLTTARAQIYCYPYYTDHEYKLLYGLEIEVSEVPNGFFPSHYEVGQTTVHAAFIGALGAYVAETDQGLSVSDRGAAGSFLGSNNVPHKVITSLEEWSDNGFAGSWAAVVRISNLRDRPTYWNFANFAWTEADIAGSDTTVALNAIAMHEAGHIMGLSDGCNGYPPEKTRNAAGRWPLSTLQRI